MGALALSPHAKNMNKKEQFMSSNSFIRRLRALPSCSGMVNYLVDQAHSQADLARATGIDPSVINKLFHGNAESLAVEPWKRLVCKYLVTKKSLTNFNNNATM